MKVSCLNDVDAHAYQRKAYYDETEDKKHVLGAKRQAISSLVV